MTKLKNIAVAVAALVIFSNITNAQAVKTSYSVIAEEPLKVKYLGDEGEYLVFAVTLESSKVTNAKFAIVDDAEGELYSSFVGTSLNAKTVKIEKKDADQVLNFKMTVGKKTYSKAFFANTNLVETTTVEETSITKL